jgi:phosphoribosylaminoimidazole-succinocarboxamide synthase (EC 6.3.2.6)
VDFKLEFGTDASGNILVGDEISPDSCRLWDDRAGDLSDRIMDKDRFRQDLGKIAETYQAVADRIQAVG